ncbi:hypothetical protein EDD66_11526 [Mobilisporobacter senegalensis]|uniref:Zn-dependent protease n=1 Tax=Mobilisporobacter senegalensis TaxID=1329262 RepID=A0A3N1X8G7_9FIRM|nr:hypothetical protein [Mobilisporobacter senegalensis]ROR22341.1 hypothetical protein EDD66_11526 [Mobilisporobacter senegalensis]
MKEQILQLVTLVIAGILVMILHELPKSIMYNLKNKNQSPNIRRKIYKLFHYIDPIGLILCITTLTGFSKPYMYRIKEKKTNLMLGITGLISLFIIFLFSITIWKIYYPIGDTFSYSTTVEWVIKNFPNYLFQFIAVISMNMIFVNLIPISTFDLGLIIAGKSPGKYFSIIRNDYLIKMILILAIVFRIIPNMSNFIIQLFIVL